MESYWWKKANEQANTTEVDVVNLFLSSIDSLSDSDNIWFLDCANINHITQDRRLCQSIKISNTNEVRISDGKTEKIEGIGTIEIHTRSRHNKILEDVYYVSKFTHNLLSL